MKIKELLERTLTEPIDIIARDRLTIGKNAARDALKAAGCFSKNGTRGWHYEGDPSVLEKSIYDFVISKPSQTLKEKNNPRIQPSGKENRKTEKKEPVLEKVFKKATYEVEEALHDEIKIRAIREKRTVSEIVNEIFKKALK